jgi:hypothetical protein
MKRHPGYRASGERRAHGEREAERLLAGGLQAPWLRAETLADEGSDAWKGSHRAGNTGKDYREHGLDCRTAGDEDRSEREPAIAPHQKQAQDWPKH